MGREWRGGGLRWVGRVIGSKDIDHRHMGSKLSQLSGIFRNADLQRTNLSDQNKVWTLYLPHIKQVLYQLSYAPSLGLGLPELRRISEIWIKIDKGDTYKKLAAPDSCFVSSLRQDLTFFRGSALKSHKFHGSAPRFQMLLPPTPLVAII